MDLRHTDKNQIKFNIISTVMKHTFKNSGYKATAFLMFLLFTFFVAYSQTDSTKSEVRKDTTRIDLGQKELQITTGPAKGDKEIRLKDKHKHADETDDNVEKKTWKSGGFKGHWAGLELGLNNYLNKDYSMSLSGDDEFLSLNTGRSINVNVNFGQHSFGIIGNCVGMVTGMGLEFFNYFYEHNNSIQMDPNGVVSNLPYDPIQLDKSKLTISYLTVPLLLEFQFPGQLRNSHRLRISVGVIGGLKLGSHTKVVYRVNGDKKKDKDHSDFNINSLRYGFTARIGYKHINLFSNFYPVTLFEKGKGPILYPFSLGIAFVGI
jgi:hypothetical protein